MISSEQGAAKEKHRKKRRRGKRDGEETGNQKFKFCSQIGSLLVYVGEEIVVVVTVLVTVLVLVVRWKEEGMGYPLDI